MTTFKTSIDLHSKQFGTQKKFMEKCLNRVHDLYEHQSESLKPIITQSRNNLSVWSRIYLLIDQESPFLEIMPIAGDGARPCGAICGLGKVSGCWVVLFANDPSILGGALTSYVYEKWARALEISKENHLPYISLVQSAGFDLRQKASNHSSKNIQMPHFGSTGKEFYDLTQLSANGIPTISIVFGSATAGGAYQPALSDYTIMVKDHAQVYLAGPPLLKMATGQIVDGESLGGANMHCKTSGLGDYLCHDEVDAIMQCKKIVNTFQRSESSVLSYQKPVYALEDLMGWQHPEHKMPVDVRELIVRLIDDESEVRFKPDYGIQMECGFGTIFGHKVGYIANQGVILPEAAMKAAHFVQLCNQNACPIIFLHNTTGFMVGESYEQSGIIKYGAQLINVISNSSVPHISLIFGASYGAGNYAMSGKAFNNRFIFSWPNARVGVMGEKQIAGVLGLLKEAKARKLNKPLDVKEHAAYLQAIEEAAREDSDAITMSRLCADDGIIDPRDSRTVLGICCDIVYAQPIVGQKNYGVFRF